MNRATVEGLGLTDANHPIRMQTRTRIRVTSAHIAVSVAWFFADNHHSISRKHEQFVHGSETSIATILSTRNPGFTSRTFIKLRPSKPAPITSTNVMAICAATIARPTRWLPCDPACPRPPSTRPFIKSPRVARAAVNAPSPAATAAQSKNAKSSTGTLTETQSSSRQVFRSQGHQSGDAQQRGEHSKNPADQREQKCFGQELAH